MFRFALPALFAAMVAAAPAAQAATFVLTPTPGPDGSFSLAFSNEGIGAGEFEDIFEITLPLAGRLSASITTISSSIASNIDFTSVTLNDVNFTLTPVDTVEQGSVGPLNVGTGLQRLVVRGVSGGSGSFAGTLSFAVDQAPPGVPEPASWALMIMGFGGAGLAVRARRRGSPIAA